jgi:Mitochondrial carrier protein
MQVSGLGIGTTVSSLVKTEGIPAFWKGLFFAYGRELSYTSIKLGAYAPVRDALGAGKDAPFYLKFLSGAITGGVGSVVGYVIFVIARP